MSATHNTSSAQNELRGPDPLPADSMERRRSHAGRGTSANEPLLALARLLGRQAALEAVRSGSPVPTAIKPETSP